MKWVAALGVVAAVMVVCRIWRRLDEASRFAEWRVDHDRRQWCGGIDGPAWRWPINKVRNESAQWNRQTLKRRA